MTSDAVAEPAPAKRTRFYRFARWCGRTMLFLLVTGTAAWSLLAVRYAALTSPEPRLLAMLILLAAYVACWRLLKSSRARIAGSLALSLATLIWFLSMQPSQNRDWPAETAELSRITHDGDVITVHNVRNFARVGRDRPSADPATPSQQWETRTYDLSQLESVDFILCDFGAMPMAHTMLSFGFSDGQYLCVSIESRREKHETFSPWRGLFRNYELVYLFGDERVLLRLRTHVRKETVYLYRTRTTPEVGRALLLDYVRRANELADRPAFYNSLTDNCTTGIKLHVRTVASAPYALEVLLPGLTDRYAHRHGLINSAIPFDELKARSRINQASLDADPGENFSRQIRHNLPAAR
jgi:hypothetical protein